MRALRNLPLIRRLLPWLLLAAYLALIAPGFGPYLGDDHAFRQTQTAIGAYYFEGFADLLRYQTPVLGSPWSIPFEFPLYQALAKALHVVSGAPLVASGRWISVVFFLACLWPLSAWLGVMGVRERALVVAPLLLAPLYLFWSRAFMIETAALFFTLLYAWRATVALRSPSIGPAEWVVVALAGALAALVKITTVAPVVLALLVAQAWLAWLGSRSGSGTPRLAVRSHLAVLAAHGTVLAAGVRWVSYADAIKAQNPLGAHLTSASLREWNFGTWAQRADADTWWLLLDRTFDFFFPAVHGASLFRLGLIGAAVVFAIVCFMACDGTRRRLVVAVLALYLLPYALFTNLHRVHNYYQVANGVFLCVAVGMAVQGAAARTGAARWLLIPYAFLLLASAYAGVRQFDAARTHTGWRVQVSEFVRATTSPDSVLVIAGQDWAPIIPFQSQRKALMLPIAVGTAQAREHALRGLLAGGARVEAYVACGSMPHHDDEARRHLRLEGTEPVARIEGCAVYRVPPR